MNNNDTRSHNGVIKKKQFDMKSRDVHTSSEGKEFGESDFMTVNS